MKDWERKPGFDLSGKKALVVGFGNPVGEAVALALAEAGADVAAASATLDGEEVMAAKRVAKRVTQLGRTSMSQGWDVTLPTNVQVGLRQLVKEFGTPSILVFNGDAELWKPATKITDSEFANVQQVNQSGAYYAARSFLRERKDTEVPGRLIFVTSILGERGVGWNTGYAVTKSGALGLMLGLSQEFGQQNVTANAISTGWMEWTPGRGPDDIGENRLMRFIPMRRFGKAEDVAPLAVLLASDAAGYLNGQVFHVDGGVSQHL
ncbi:MAG: SDR family oxidoreductase [Dehalococcoidia bacterium]|nr:SDR family oxidoreductase [Dehalococcoidia bacterium]